MRRFASQEGGRIRMMATVVAALVLSSILTTRAAVGTAVGWGDHTVQVSNLTAIAAGYSHSMGITPAGEVVHLGAFGPGATGMSNAAAIALGNLHGLKLEPNGRVTGFGSSFYGEASLVLSNITAIAAGDQHSVALIADGTVTAWGNNYSGRTNVPVGLSNVVAIAAGDIHGLALKRNGTVVAWGSDGFGYLRPPFVPPGLSNIVAVAGGQNFSLALKNDGRVIAWGSNEFNDFGKTPVPNDLSNVVAVAAGERHALALKSDGTVVAWGHTNAGQTEVPAGLTNAIAIAAAGYRSLALVNDGSPAIGWQSYDQIGYTGSSATLGVGAVGNPPLRFQWRFDGMEIDGATNAFLTLRDLDIADGGRYDVLIVNDVGATTSRPIHLPVIVSAPRITAQPTNIAAVTAANAAFSPVVEGSEPLSFQWSFNGNPLPGATNASLVFTNVQASNAGVYTLTTSNLYGAVTSDAATLTYIPMQFTILSRTADRFYMRLVGLPQNIPTAIYGSTNLVDWVLVYQIRPGSRGYPPVVDLTPSVTNYPSRFYRAQTE